MHKPQRVLHSCIHNGVKAHFLIYGVEVGKGNQGQQQPSCPPACVAANIIERLGRSNKGVDDASWFRQTWGSLSGHRRYGSTHIAPWLKYVGLRVIVAAAVNSFQLNLPEVLPS